MARYWRQRKSTRACLDPARQHSRGRCTTTTGSRCAARSTSRRRRPRSMPGWRRSRLSRRRSRLRAARGASGCCSTSSTRCSTPRAARRRRRARGGRCGAARTNASRRGRRAAAAAWRAYTSPLATTPSPRAEGVATGGRLAVRRFAHPDAPGGRAAEPVELPRRRGPFLGEGQEAARDVGAPGGGGGGGGPNDPALANARSQQAANVVHPPQLPSRVCARCGAEAGSQCGACGAVSYCGAACATADWRAHRRVCARDAGAAAAQRRRP